MLIIQLPLTNLSFSFFFGIKNVKGEIIFFLRVYLIKSAIKRACGLNSRRAFPHKSVPFCDAQAREQ